jgi:hypothetical protein
MQRACGWWPTCDVVTREAAEALLQLLPQARRVDIAAASHMVAGGHNGVYSAAVLEFALPLLQQTGTDERTE